MKNILPNTLTSITLFLLLSATAHATIDSGRQYSSAKEARCTDELTLRVNQVYRLYLSNHTHLSTAQKKQLRTTLQLVYRQLQNQPGPAGSWKKIVAALTGSATPGSETINDMDSGELKKKKKFLSFLRSRSKPVLNELNAAEKKKNEHRPKQAYQFKFFKWVE